MIFSDFESIDSLGLIDIGAVASSLPLERSVVEELCVVEEQNDLGFFKRLF